MQQSLMLMIEDSLVVIKPYQELLGDGDLGYTSWKQIV